MEPKNTPEVEAPAVADTTPEVPAAVEPSPYEASGVPGTGTVRVSGHLHPFRLFDGRVEYQLRSGEWRAVPETYEVL